MPSDPALQHLLYDPSEEQDVEEDDAGSEERLMKALNNAKVNVISTRQWNPLLFAIFYGQIPIVKYIIEQAEAGGGPTSFQHLHYLLGDIVKMVSEVQQMDGSRAAIPEYDEEDDEEDGAHLDARVSLMPLVICLMTN